MCLSSLANSGSQRPFGPSRQAQRIGHWGGGAMRAITSVLLALVLVAGCAAEPTSSTLQPAGPSPTSTTFAATTTTATTTTNPTSTTPPATTTAVTTASTTTLIPVTGLESGLFCRDLLPRGYRYAEAVQYWMLEGRPDRMDADANGMPCETVYGASDVTDYWGENPPTTTTTTGSPPPGYVPTTPGSLPPSLPGSGDAIGSGCTPGSDTLPDGIWFVFPADRSADRLEFDLACFFYDESAVDEDQQIFYTNESAHLREVAVAGDAVVHEITWNPWYSIIDYDEWRDHPCELPGCPIWIYINASRITHIVEQFFS